MKSGLAPSPELWAWSSFRAYFFGEKSVVWIEGLNPNPQGAHSETEQSRTPLTLYPILANGTREWCTRRVEKHTMYQYGNGVGHPASRSCISSGSNPFGRTVYFGWVRLMMTTSGR